MRPTLRMTRIQYEICSDGVQVRRLSRFPRNRKKHPPSIRYFSKRSQKKNAAIRMASIKISRSTTAGTVHEKSYMLKAKQKIIAVRNKTLSMVLLVILGTPISQLYHTKLALARWNRARARKKGVSTYGKLTAHIVPERM